MPRMILALAHRALPVIATAGLLILIFLSCDTPYSPPFPNSLPDSRLANVPENDTIGVNIDQGVIPEQTLYWTADDPDGYIVAYRFRWIDFYDSSRDTTTWTRILNITNLGGSALDTFVLVHPNAPSVFRIYNFLATIRSNDQATISSIRRLLSTGRYFAVPYTEGPIAGDSIIGSNPVLIEAPNKGTFIFNSPSDSNQHRFEVRGVDNSDAEDPTPAVVNFWTRRSEGPIVFFTGGPSMAFPQFIIRCPTQRNPGLTFTFGGFDRTTSDREYSWNVDDTTTGWSAWSVQPRGIVTAADLRETGSDTHTAYVRGRNRWGVVSPIARRPFRAVIPVIDDPNRPQRILLFNNTRDQNFPAVPDGAIDSASLVSFYSELLDSAGWAGRYDVFNRRQGAVHRFINRMKLSEYIAVVFIADARISSPFGGASWQVQADKLDSLREYLNYGGKLIWSGTPQIKTMFGGGGYPRFAYEVFHTENESPQTPFREDPQPNFVGATGRLGYPDISLDPLKVPPDSLGLRYISTHWPRGFGVTILEWRHRTGSPLFEGVPLGIRYNGSPADPGPFCRETFSVVYFGFPMYYAQKSQAIQAMRKAIQDIHLN